MFTEQLRATHHGWDIVVIDREYTIVAAGRPRSVGMKVLEKPGVRDVYLTHCERVWETGEPLSIRVFCVGKVWESHLRLIGGNLECVSRIVCEIEHNDLVTIDRLRDSLTLASACLASAAGDPPYQQHDEAPRSEQSASLLSLVRIDAPDPADAALPPASDQPA